MPMARYPLFDHDWQDDERAAYARDGFVIVEDLVDRDFAATLGERFEPLFAGNFETGIEPEMCPVYVTDGAAPAQGLIMVNVWRCDHTVSVLTLNPDIGRMIAGLNGWTGARILQDNLHWKPPGAPGGHFHQDFSYHRWAVPNRLASAWVALGDTTADGGTFCLSRGSHLWPEVADEAYESKIGARNLEGFLDPQDHRGGLMTAAKSAGEKPDLAYIEVAAGSAVFFNDHIWHGADANNGANHRKAISIHCLVPETTFHPTITGHIQCRYRKVGDPTLDEAYFPIVWQEDGYRTPWLDAYVREGSAAALWA